MSKMRCIFYFVKVGGLPPLPKLPKVCYINNVGRATPLRATEPITLGVLYSFLGY